MNTSIYAARVELMLAELRLPTIRLMWKKLAEQSDKEGWPAARFLAALAEHEMAVVAADRQPTRQSRKQRHQKTDRRSTSIKALARTTASVNHRIARPPPSHPD